MAGAGQAGAAEVGSGPLRAGSVAKGAEAEGSRGVAREAEAATRTPEAVIMPRLDMTTEEMTILRWMKGDGERIEMGEPLLEVMTEKIAIEIDAPASGYVRGIRFKPEAVVPVGEVIAFIAAEAGDPVPGTRAEEVDVPVTSESPAAGSARSNGGMASSVELVRAAPIVRRIAAELGVDLGRVTGTGPGGRVLADDVRTLAAAVGKPATGVASATGSEGLGAKGIELTAGAVDGLGAIHTGSGDDAVVESKLTPTRRAIARRMEASWRTAPHVTLTIDVDMSEAATFRERLRGALAAEGSDVSFTWNSLIAWVAVQALVRRPELNATLEDDTLRQYADIHLGVAVDTPAGLLVPVIHSAQRLRPAQLAVALADAAGKAVGGGLQPMDMSGGTFTVTNLGAFGIGAFTPVLNPPQVAILGVGAVRDKVIPVNGAPHVRPVCTFSLSFDHRAADGADGARYLALLKELLLDPHRLIV